MPVKKKAVVSKKKVVARKPVAPKVEVGERIVPHKRNIEPHHYHFGGLLALVVGFSAYAFASSFSATNTYLDSIEANVLNVDPALIEEVTDASSVIDTTMNPFVDLPNEHPNKAAILDLYYKGVLTGDDSGKFRPDDKVNRAEFAKIIVEAADVDLAAVAVSENCFGDVKTLGEHWFAPHVCAVKAQNLMNGYEGNVFSPVKFINRAESLKVVLDAFDFEVAPNNKVMTSLYQDVKASDWFLGVAASAAANGLVSEGGNFDAGREITRGEVAQIVYNALVKKGGE